MTTELEKSKQALATATRSNPFWDALSCDRSRKAIQAVAAKHISVERMIRLAYLASTKNPRLAECSPPSIVQAMVEASSLGLEIGTVDGDAYLVPYRNKQTNRYEATLQIGYRGYLKRALRSGRVETIVARVVYDCDRFSWREGTSPAIEHIPMLPRSADAQPVCVYARAVLASGRVDFLVLDIVEVEKRRAVSRGSDGDFWTKWFDAMACKTVLRDYCKHVLLLDEIFAQDKPEAIDPETGEVTTTVEEPAQIAETTDGVEVIS